MKTSDIMIPNHVTQPTFPRSRFEQRFEDTSMELYFLHFSLICDLKGFFFKQRKSTFWTKAEYSFIQPQ